MIYKYLKNSSIVRDTLIVIYNAKGRLKLSQLGLILAVSFLCKPVIKFRVYHFIIQGTKQPLSVAGREKADQLSLTGYTGKYFRF